MRKLVAIAALMFTACNSGGGGDSNTLATPTFSPAAGTYNAVQSVTITCATAGAAIHFTTDGSTPTATSPTYATAVPVATTTTIKAIATATGKTDSAVASATYTLQAGTPVISPAAGTYATAQSVTISGATPGAAIHYTINGSTPSSTSPTYATAIALPVGATAATTTIKAIALATGFADSAVASSTFVIDPNATPAAAPTFSPPAGTYALAQTVTLSTATAGTTIYYTTDGSTPTAASTVYSTPVPVAASLTLKAIAAGGGHTPSTVASAAYVINLPQAATPTFSPGAGTYTSAQSVIISSTTTGAVIYYTADGSAPTTASTLYSAAVPVAASKTLKAIATATGFATSAVGTASYVIGGGGGTSFLAVCSGVFDKQISLYQSCLHWNPDVISSAIGSSQVFCADTQKEITAGLITYNETQGTACANASQALTCPDLVSADGVTTPAACDTALVGTVNTGGNCYSSANCKTGYCTWDYIASATCPGTCQAFVQLGGNCSIAPCADGLACDGSLGTPVCKAESPVGGACPCQSSLWCDTAGGGAGVCKAALALGASCTLTSDHCNILTKCAGTPATCQSYVGLGATCTGGTDPFDSLCGFGYVCDAGTSKCVSWPKVGESCATIFICINAYCDSLATSPTCKAYLADGATCNPALFGMECASHRCNTTTLKCDPSPLNRCALP
jgi:hypothetical protein